MTTVKLEAPLDVRCPHGTAQEGPPVSGPSVICGVMANTRGLAPSGKQRNSHSGALVTVGEDPSSVGAFCCSEYWTCPVYEADQEAQRERRDSLLRGGAGGGEDEVLETFGHDAIDLAVQDASPDELVDG